jgi:hypothetical protein
MYREIQPVADLNVGNPTLTRYHRAEEIDPAQLFLYMYRFS